ncbi:hypothetical protein [Flavobacterium magnesitis]|uniref:hypothetical protein n=1 Tax=Flavobacterium magnesitis TaxID=3138077 RepID=UPI00358EDBD4
MEIHKMLKSIILCICICSIISCNNKQKSDEIKSLKSLVNSTLWEKLILPESLQTYIPFSKYIADSSVVLNSDYRIYSKLNASCGTCISNINEWENLIPEFSKYKVPVVLICDSDDRFEMFKYLCETRQVKNFSYPFFLDKKKVFAKKNRFMEVNQNFETVLTDKNNNIIMMGNPIKSNEIKNLYLKEIRKRLGYE